MSRSEDKKGCYSRWSEPLLRRRYSMSLVPTSGEETSSVRQSRSSSPFLTSLHRPIHPLDLPFGCCSCHSYCFKRMSKSRSADSSKAKTKHYKHGALDKSSGTRCGSQQMRENLEIQLVGSQVEETLASDNQAALIRQLELATDVLEALIQHTRSLQISQLSAQRVVQLSHQLIMPYRPSSTSCNSSPSTELTTFLCQVESLTENRLHQLKDVIENCLANTTLSKQLQTVIDNYRIKKENFKVAAENFKSLLENSKLTVSQMDKLQWQYEAIIDDYRQNRRILESELPKIVKIRLKAIQQSFCSITTFYEDSEYSKIIGNLLQIVGEKLHRKDPGIQEEEITDSTKPYIFSPKSS